MAEKTLKRRAFSDICSSIGTSRTGLEPGVKINSEEFFDAGDFSLVINADGLSHY
ncbi:hypothetical protein [Erythrobacter aureus]|uniref:hypothetical protein n=1 Tax=Erythrobacter aureus TaxID=2182384 RepID=UPI0013B45CEC|nr:hypothetical protein [Erythrobacter aureus]